MNSVHGAATATKDLVHTSSTLLPYPQLIKMDPDKDSGTKTITISKEEKGATFFVWKQKSNAICSAKALDNNILKQ